MSEYRLPPGVRRALSSDLTGDSAPMLAYRRPRRPTVDDPRTEELVVHNTQTGEILGRADDGTFTQTIVPARAQAAPGSRRQTTSNRSEQSTQRETEETIPDYYEEPYLLPGDILLEDWQSNIYSGSLWLNPNDNEYLNSLRNRLMMEGIPPTGTEHEYLSNYAWYGWDAELSARALQMVRSAMQSRDFREEFGFGTSEQNHLVQDEHIGSNPVDWSDYNAILDNSALIDTIANDVAEASGMHPDEIKIFLIASLHAEARWRTDVPRLGWAGDTASILLGYDASIGPFNIRPSVVDEMYGTNQFGEPYIIASDDEVLMGYRPLYGFEDRWIEARSTYRDSLPVFPDDPLTPSTPNRAPFSATFELLHNTTTNFYVAGENTYRGITRAQELGIEPTIFNLATWFNRGIQTQDELTTANNRDNDWGGFHTNRVLQFAAGIISSEEARRDFGIEINPAEISFFSNDEFNWLNEDIQELYQEIGIVGRNA